MFKRNKGWLIALVSALVLLLAACGGVATSVATSTPAPTATLSAAALAAYRVECQVQGSTVWFEDHEFTAIWETHEINRPCDGVYVVTTTFESGIDASWVGAVVVEGWDPLCYGRNLLDRRSANPDFCIVRDWPDIPPGTSREFDQPFLMSLSAPDGK
jgi:hypothetical protein